VYECVCVCVCVWACVCLRFAALCVCGAHQYLLRGRNLARVVPRHMRTSTLPLHVNFNIIVESHLQLTMRTKSPTEASTLETARAISSMASSKGTAAAPPPPPSPSPPPADCGMGAGAERSAGCSACSPRARACSLSARCVHRVGARATVAVAATAAASGGGGGGSGGSSGGDAFVRLAHGLYHGVERNTELNSAPSSIECQV
jgi:hypothetical protein